MEIPHRGFERGYVLGRNSGREHRWQERLDEAGTLQALGFDRDRDRFFETVDVLGEERDQARRTATRASRSRPLAGEAHLDAGGPP